MHWKKGGTQTRDWISFRNVYICLFHLWDLVLMIAPQRSIIVFPRLISKAHEDDLAIKSFRFRSPLSVDTCVSSIFSSFGSKAQNSNSSSWPIYSSYRYQIIMNFWSWILVLNLTIVLDVTLFCKMALCLLASWSLIEMSSIFRRSPRHA